MPIRISDESRLLVVRWEGQATDDEVSRYFDRLRDHTADRDAYAMLYDFRHATIPSSTQRRRFAELTRQRGAELRESCVGIAFVIDAVLVRAALSAMLWLQPMHVPHLVADSVEDGERWARARLEAARHTAAS